MAKKNEKSIEQICSEIRASVDKTDASITYLKNFNKENNKTWSWFQDNDPNKLESMAHIDPKRFSSLYFEEFGVYPENNLQIK